jgi:crotonobetainyl-CoA:carnitine CoA-transferase CaiB-like acyl-CoA transferase
MSGSPWRLRRTAPLLGEHTAEVLGEIGYTDADIGGLSAAGVILVNARGQ